MTRNAAIFLPNWIGDAVMATPTLRALRKHLGEQATITGIGKPSISRLLEGTGLFDYYIPFDRRSQSAEFRSMSVAKKLRALEPSLAVYLSSSLVPAIIGWTAGAVERIGYCLNGRRPLLSIGLKPPSRKPRAPVVSTVDYYLQLAYAIGCPEQTQRVELVVTQKDQRKCERAWRNLGIDRFRKVVLLNAANGNGDSRTWPVDYFADLARRIVRDPDTAVLFLCGPGEQDLVAEIERRADHRQVRSMANQDLGLGVAKGCIQRADLLVTTDNGPRHLAAAFSTPTLLLAGAFDPLRNNNYNPYETAIRQTVDCQPCNSLVCPLKHVRCMKELHPERVYQSVQQILAKPDRRAA